MSINWQLDVQPAPAILVLPLAVESLDEAHAAIELWEHYSGKTLDPTQRLVVEVMMAQTGGGRWAASTTGREMPRQNGKGDEIEVVELWGLAQRAEAILHTVHDAVLLATQTQQRMLSTLEGHADLRRLVKRKWQGTGQQMIEMRNGGIIWYRTRTGGGGRGVDDIDRLVIDEAQHATEEHLAAVSPTLFANANPQLNALGTAGIDGHSDWWWMIRKRALSDDPGSFGYVGHTAERPVLEPDGRVTQPPVDVTDRKLWMDANPSLWSPRASGKLEFLEEQLRNLGPESFAREHLGVWDPEPSASAGCIDPAVWAALEDVEDVRPSPVAVAVEMSSDRKWTMLVLAGVRSDGDHHVEVIQSERGSGWVPDRVAELAKKWSAPVGLDPAGPAGSLIPALSAVGVEPALVTGRDYASACGAFLDRIMEGRVHHSAAAGSLLGIAVQAAGQHARGGAWVWESVRESTDIAALRGATIASRVLEREASRPKTRSGVVI